MPKEIERSGDPLYHEPKIFHIENFGEFTIVQNPQPDGRYITQLTTNFKLFVLGTDAEDAEFEAAVDGVEALMLGMASVGIDITAENIVLAIQTALIAVAQNFLE